MGNLFYIKRFRSQCGGCGAITISDEVIGELEHLPGCPGNAPVEQTMTVIKVPRGALQALLDSERMSCHYSK